MCSRRFPRRVGEERSGAGGAGRFFLGEAGDGFAEVLAAPEGAPWPQLPPSVHAEDVVCYIVVAHFDVCPKSSRRRGFGVC